MRDVSVICVYNKKNVLDEVLLKNIPQSDKIELVLIDNSKNKFKSASSALNYGAEISKNDMLMFVHQDIDFKKTDNFISICKQALPLIQDGSIVGVAGKAMGINSLITNITYGSNKNKYDSIKFDKPYAVDTVDECLFILSKNTWLKHKFDEALCDNWHLYSVEICLWARLNGKNVFVIPADVNHYSQTGTLNKSFFDTLYKLKEKYCDKFLLLNTSCITIGTRHYKLNLLYYKMHTLKMKILRSK